MVPKALGMFCYTTHRMVAKLRRSAYPDLDSDQHQDKRPQPNADSEPERGGAVPAGRASCRDMKAPA